MVVRSSVQNAVLIALLGAGRLETKPSRYGLETVETVLPVPRAAVEGEQPARAMASRPSWSPRTQQRTVSGEEVPKMPRTDLARF